MTQRAIAGSVVLLAFLAGTALGAVPHSWEPGDGLTADDLNGNFTDLDQRLAALEAARLTTGPQGLAIRAGSVFVTKTATSYAGALTFPGGFTGYTAAKKICETEAGSVTAHLCSSEEVRRSAQIGIAAPEGRVSGPYDQGPTTNVADCLGWTSTSSQELSHIWQALAAAVPGVQACNAQTPLLCCD